MNSEKPKKPYADFPLFPHATKRWAKKIRGKMEYFGPWNDPDAALQKYLDQQDDLQAGRRPRHPADTRLTIKELCDRFYENKENKFNSRELSRTMLAGYRRICEMLVKIFGRDQVVEDLRVADFEKLRSRLAKGTGEHSGKNVGLVTLANPRMFLSDFTSLSVNDPLNFRWL